MTSAGAVVALGLGPELSGVPAADGVGAVALVGSDSIAGRRVSSAFEHDETASTRTIARAT